MDKQTQLELVKHHWAMYIFKGGIYSPLKEHDIGVLRRGGIEHWASFLKHAKFYIKEHKGKREDLEMFVPKKLVKMLIGE